MAKLRIATSLLHLDSRQLSRILVGFALACGALLRTVQLSSRPLWFDEAFSWRVSRFPVREMLSRVAGDNHPPLYFLVLKGWMTLFGDSAFAIRSLSVLFGELSILLGYLLARELVAWRQERPTESLHVKGPLAHLDVGTPILVAFGLAFSPVDIWWSGSARMYSMGTCGALLSTIALVRSVRSNGKSWRTWAAYGVTGVLFLYTHYFALFTIAAQYCFLAGYLAWQTKGKYRERRQAVGQAALSLAVMVAGFGPWIPAFVRQNRQMREEFWTEPVVASDVVNTAYQLLIEPRNAAYCESSVGFIVAGAYLAVLAACAMVPTRERLLLVILVALPPLLVVGLSLYGSIHLVHWRYFAFSHAFFWLSLAFALSQISDHRAWCIVSAGVLCASLSASVSFFRNLDVPARQGLRAAMATVAQRDPGSMVLVGIPELYLPAWYYAPDRSLVRLYYQPGKVPHYYGASTIDPLEIIDRNGVADLIAHERRLWVVDPGRDVLAPLMGDPWEAAFEQREFDLVTNLEVVLRRFERNVAAPAAADQEKK